MGRVVIVGAGPGGSILAFLLARRGIDVVLFERQTDFSREFRGEVLMPGGLEPFKQIGLWDELNSVPHVTPDAVALYVNGKLGLRASLSTSLFGDLKPRWTSQPALLEMLVEQSQQFENFQFERGVVVRGLIEEDDRVVGVKIAGDRELRCDLVVGADGRTSIVRRRSGLAVSRDPTPMDIVWLKLPMPDFFSSDPHIRAYVGGGHLLIAAPVPDGQMQLAWIIAKGSYGALRERGIPDCIDQMMAHVSSDLAQHLKQYREDSVHPFVLSTVSDRVERWSRPGMLLIGDAAHTMSPVGGQGLNIAIRDAVVAANHLVDVFEASPTSTSIDEAAKSIEQERLPEVSQIQRMQALPPRILFSDSLMSRILLSILPTIMGSGVSFVRNRFLPFAFGVTDVKLRV